MNAEQVTKLVSQVNNTAKPEIVSHILALTQAIGTLTPCIAIMRNGYGMDIKVIKIQGTLPIYFQRNRYSIPIYIILPEEYPYYPPKVYVMEVNNILIRPNHPHVDKTGLCYAPYLSEWKMNSHNLYGLCNYLSALFGENPPVYSAPTPVNSVHPTNQHYSYPQPHPVNPYQPQMIVNPHMQNGLIRPQEIQELKSKVMAKIQSKFKSFQTTFVKGMNEQEVLRTRCIQADNDIKRATDTLAQARTEISNLNEKISALRNYNATHANKEVNIEEALVIRDNLRALHLETLSEISAIDDCLYTLDSLLQDGRISTENYLKNVRQLARNQFHARVMSDKIIQLNSSFI